MKPLVLWGATGQAVVLEEFVSALGYRVVAVFDNDPARPSPFADVPIYHGADGFRRWRAATPGEAWGAVAIGGAAGETRLEILQLLREAGLGIPALIHPAAYVARNAVVGEGSQVLAGAVVGAAVRIGSACIVNTRASVDHESVLEDGAHVAPGATLSGLVHLGRCAFVGTGAAVLPRVRIGADAIVGAGAVVVRDVPPGKTVVGVPARPRAGIV